jgi:hypothetical protein
MDEIGRGAVSYLAGCAKRVAIAGRTGILRDKYANFGIAHVLQNAYPLVET